MASTNPLCGEEVETYLWLHHRPIICIVNLVVTECGVKTFGLGHSKKGCVGAQVVCIAGTSGSHNEPQSIGDLPFANPPGIFIRHREVTAPAPNGKIPTPTWSDHGIVGHPSISRCVSCGFGVACYVGRNVTWCFILFGTPFEPVS